MLKYYAMKIVGYIRESTREQAIHGYNIHDQERKIREYCSLYYDKDFDLKILADAGSSAKSLSRPKMQEMINMIKLNDVDIIIIHNLDRLTRRVKDLIYLLELLKKYNVDLVSIKEKLDTETAMGSFSIYLIVLIAQWEQDIISDRTIRGITEGIIQKKYAKPRLPLGYYKNKEKMLEINQEEAKIVKEIFNYAQDNLSLRNICNIINRKYPFLSFNSYKMKNIIKNKLYIGIMEYRGHIVNDFCDSIITEDIFNEANRNIIFNHRHSRHNYYFRNVIFDDKGFTVTGSSAYNSERVYLYYNVKSYNYMLSQKMIVKALEGELDYITKLYLLSINKNYDCNKEIKKIKLKEKELMNAYHEDLITYDNYLENQQIINERLHLALSTNEAIKNKKIKPFNELSDRDKTRVVNKYISKIIVNEKKKLKIIFKK